VAWEATLVSWRCARPAHVEIGRAGEASDDDHGEVEIGQGCMFYRRTMVVEGWTRGRLALL
jgi:hypothetical protein